MVIDALMCYAPSEKQQAEMLADSLAALEAEGLLALRWDPDATDGSRFTAAIRDRIDEADVVLLLMSKAFLGSNFCQDQMNHAIDRGIDVVPVILESCDWMKTAARQPNSLPSDGNPISTWNNHADALADVAEGATAACKHYSLRVGQWAGELNKEECSIMERLYPNKRLDGLELWDAKHAMNASYLPAFMELLSDKKYIDRDFSFSVTFPFWRQRFWLTKRGRRVVAQRLEQHKAMPSSA